MKKIILIYIYSIKRFNEYMILNNVLKKDFNCLFLSFDINTIKLFEKYNLEYIRIDRLEKTLISRFSKFVRKLYRVKRFSIIQLLCEFLYENEFLVYNNFMDIVIRQNRISLFVTLFDNAISHAELGILYSLKRKGIPIFLPYLVNYDPVGNYEVIKNNPNYKLTEKSSWYEKRTFKKYKYLEYKGLHYYQAFSYRILEKYKMIPKVAWMQGGGVSSKVSVPNIAKLNRYKAFNIEDKKLCILPDISLFDLYTSYKNLDLKEVIIRKYALNSNKIIIIALPNYLEHHLADETTHWKIIFNIIEATLKVSNSFSVLLSLHPSQKLESYKFLEKKYNISILEERVKDILPVADIYISDESSTIPWAILCGIKTLIVNYYMSYNLYPYLNSIVYANKEDIISEKLEEIINTDVSFSKDWEVLSRNETFCSNMVSDYINTIKNIIE